jgi:hypothetical protein
MGFRKGEKCFDSVLLGFIKFCLLSSRLFIKLIETTGVCYELTWLDWVDYQKLLRDYIGEIKGLRSRRNI